MFHRGLLCVTLAALAACVVAVSPTVDAATRLPGVIDIPCATRILEQPADWYLPTGTPRGLVWLQHGFARTDANVGDLAVAFAAAGDLVFAPSLPFLDPTGCTLQNLGDNTGFLDNIADLFGGASDPEGPLARSLAEAARSAHHAAPAMPRSFVFVGHSAGAEAVAFVANRLRTTAPQGWSALRGLILLDPVPSFLGDNFHHALTGISATPLPVLAISAPPEPCNSLGLGTAALRSDLHRPFLGVLLPTGVHTDAEGPSSDVLGETVCGYPLAADVATLHALALGWSSDFLTGTTTPEYYPTMSGVVPAAPEALTLRGS
ncbi:alpha/beta hydrolase [Nocardia alni]|uniref:alpha/beta hydrolase n=1 Tax=Nocardia alni TaxID=2815723 RepID=UPI001C21C11E|nr:alpha/beta hydrolase [Nocardia alni]